MRIGRVWNSGPLTKYEMTKSSSDSVKAMMAPAMTPGRICGRVTLKKAWTGVQPRSWAASVRYPSIARKRGRMFRMTYGSWNVMWAMSMVPKPRTPCRCMSVPAKTNRSIMEIPVTMSGFIIGMLFVVRSVLL